MAASESNLRSLVADRTGFECQAIGDRDCARVLRRLADQIDKGAIHARRLIARQTGCAQGGFAMFELELETNATEEFPTWI